MICAVILVTGNIVVFPSSTERNNMQSSRMKCSAIQSVTEGE